MKWKPGVSPSPAQVRAAREAAGCTQEQAGVVVHISARGWQNYEQERGGNQRSMSAAMFELFLLKTGQLSIREVKRQEAA